VTEPHRPPGLALADWLEGFADGAVRREADHVVVRVRGLDRAVLGFERRRLLVAYVRRQVDERQVECAMTRVHVDHVRRSVGATRAWLASFDERLP
jgi:hypothetical protein